MVDARAAALRSRVEELARASYKERDQGFTAPGVSTELMRAGMQFPQGQGSTESGELPMLIKSTEMGVYIKWALLLQEELQRSLTLHAQLQQLRGRLETENAELSVVLGRGDPRTAPAAEGTSRVPGPGSLPSVAELQRLAGGPPGDIFGVAGGVVPGMMMGGGIHHASPKIAPPTGKRGHAAMMDGRAAPSRNAFAASARLPSAMGSSSADPSGLEGLPMTHNLSLSDFDLPDSDDVLKGVPLQKTPSRLNNEEERLLQSLIASPGMNPELLETPNLKQLATAINPKSLGAWSASERCGTMRASAMSKQANV